MCVELNAWSLEACYFHNAVFLASMYYVVLVWEYMCVSSSFLFYFSIGQDLNKSACRHHGSWFIIISSQEVTEHIFSIIPKEASIIEGWCWQLVCTGWAASLPLDNTSGSGLSVHHISVLCSYLGGTWCLLWISGHWKGCMSGKICSSTWKIEIFLALSCILSKTKLLRLTMRPSGHPQLILQTLNLYILWWMYCFVFMLYFVERPAIQ